MLNNNNNKKNYLVLFLDLFLELLSRFKTSTLNLDNNSNQLCIIEHCESSYTEW